MNQSGFGDMSNKITLFPNDVYLVKQKTKNFIYSSVDL